MQSHAEFSLSKDYQVVVVGGVGGIGSAVSRLFLDLGADVIATGLSEEEIANSGLQPHPRLRLETLDVTDDSGVASFADRLEGLDALINCAGIQYRDREFDTEIFRRVLDVNLVGTFRCCMAFRSALARRSGTVVNIASMNSYRGLPRLPAYCASKGGVVMLTKTLALAWAPDGIRVNAVAPGYIETPINADGRKDKAHYQRIAERIAFKRWGVPEEVASAIAFLCMPGARYATGTILAVDGGFLAG